MGSQRPTEIRIKMGVYQLINLWWEDANGLLNTCCSLYDHDSIQSKKSLWETASLWHNLQKQGRPQAAPDMHKIEEAQTPFPPLLRDMVWNGQDLGAGMQFPLRAGELDIHLLFTSHL